MISVSLQLVDRGSALEPIRSKPEICEAKFCTDRSVYLVEVSHPRTLSILGPGDRWMCAEHASFERGQARTTAELSKLLQVVASKALPTVVGSIEFMRAVKSFEKLLSSGDLLRVKPKDPDQ